MDFVGKGEGTHENGMVGGIVWCPQGEGSARAGRGTVRNKGGGAQVISGKTVDISFETSDSEVSLSWIPGLAIYSLCDLGQFPHL